MPAPGRYVLIAILLLIVALNAGYFLRLEGYHFPALGAGVVGAIAALGLDYLLKPSRVAGGDKSRSET